MFTNMKIGKRMALGFGLLLVIMMVLIWEGITGMSAIEGNLERIVKVNNVRIDLCCKIRSRLDTQSGLSWTPNPEATGHSIRF